MSSAGINYVGYPFNATAPVATGFTITDAGVPNTVTDKARSVAMKASDLRCRLSNLHERLWPAPKDSQVGQITPEPTALPWILESAEQELQQALGILDSIASKL